MAKDNVVFAILGNSLDAGYSERRWDRWRPTPSLVGHVDELPVSRVELIYTNPDHEKLLDVVV
ncbi:RNA repair transcriptional activator RtcR family protein, partial [Comamonas thiooxydans]|uniref:RNA repair transcriptional activator RtcR family protein n=1 Tax=Comamonas thiooxydans TaxID=363952 RepID=UPI00209BD9A6